MLVTQILSVIAMWVIKKCQNTPQLAEGMNGRGYKGTESPYPCI